MFCCRCDASVKYRVAVVVLVAPYVKKQAAAGGPLLVSCLPASTGLSARNGERRGESEEARRNGTESDAREVSRENQSRREAETEFVRRRAGCVGRRCPRAIPRRQNNGVDLGPCSGNERERERVSARGGERGRREEGKSANEGRRERDRERERGETRAAFIFVRVVAVAVSRAQPIVRVVRCSSARPRRRTQIHRRETERSAE